MSKKDLQADKAIVKKTVKEEKCADCDGKGGTFEKKVWVNCEKCKGTGKQKKL